LTVSASAPATVGNAGVGFDALGFAVQHPSDRATVGPGPGPGLRIVGLEGPFGHLVPADPKRNTAAVAVQALLDRVGFTGGLDLVLEKNLPLGSGMGSSAASAAAAVFAANVWLGEPLRVEELVPLAMEAERVACGTAHADNVAPALLGGFVLARGYDPLDLVRLPSPEGLFCTLVHPHFELRTEDSRKVLPREVPLEKAVAQWSNLAGLVAALHSGDLALLGRSLQDVLIEPLRAPLIPGFDRVKQAALSAGVLGCSISGSGPSVFALSADKTTAEAAGKAMAEVWETLGMASDVYVSPINRTGARLSV
jgi:homoserine kinase